MPQPFEPRRDPAVRHAANTLNNHFTDRSGNPIRTPYYKTQLQVLYENDYFPWVVSDAIDILVEDAFLTEFRKADIIRHPAQLPYIRDIAFVANSQAFTQNPNLLKTHALNKPGEGLRNVRLPSWVIRHRPVPESFVGFAQGIRHCPLGYESSATATRASP